MNLVSVPVDLRVTLPELANVVKMLGAKVLMGSSNIMPNFQSKVGEIVSGVTTIDLKEIAAAKSEAKGGQPWLDIDKIDFKAPAFIILTSGTTGMPKGAVHDLDSLITNLLELAEMSGIQNEMRGVLPLPLSHIFGLEVMYIAMFMGMTVVFTELTPTGFVQSVAKHKPHVVAGVPTLYGALLAGACRCARF